MIINGTVKTSKRASHKFLNWQVYGFHTFFGNPKHIKWFKDVSACLPLQ